MPSDPIKIEFNEDGLKDLVAGWVVQQMSGEQQEAVLKAAIYHLVTEPKDNYGYKRTSPLQAAFNMAVERQMNIIAQEYVAANLAVKEELYKLLGQAMAAWLQDSSHHRQALVESLALALSKP